MRENREKQEQKKYVQSVQNTPVSDDDMLQIVSESGAQDLL